MWTNFYSNSSERYVENEEFVVSFVFLRNELKSLDLQARYKTNLIHKFHSRNNAIS